MTKLPDTFFGISTVSPSTFNVSLQDGIDRLGLNEIKREREVKEHHRCCSEKVSSSLIMSRNAGSNQLMQLIVNMYKYLLV